MSASAGDHKVPSDLATAAKPISCHKSKSGRRANRWRAAPKRCGHRLPAPSGRRGPQPVTTYDQSYIQKTGYQNVTDVLQNLPIATGNFNPGVLTWVIRFYLPHGLELFLELDIEEPLNRIRC